MRNPLRMSERVFRYGGQVSRPSRPQRPDNLTLSLPTIGHIRLQPTTHRHLSCREPGSPATRKPIAGRGERRAASVSTRAADRSGRAPRPSIRSIPAASALNKIRPGEGNDPPRRRHPGGIDKGMSADILPSGRTRAAGPAESPNSSTRRLYLVLAVFIGFSAARRVSRDHHQIFPGTHIPRPSRAVHPGASIKECPLLLARFARTQAIS